MLNQVVIVGRIVQDLEIKELENGKKVANLTLAVQRPYKDENGEYGTYFIDCDLWEGIATNVNEYCHKGDIVGVKGRIQTVMNGKKKITKVCAEKVTFLSSKKKDE